MEFNATIYYFEYIGLDIVSFLSKYIKQAWFSGFVNKPEHLEIYLEFLIFKASNFKNVTSIMYFRSLIHF